jgi:hypothetical protein
MAGEAGSRQVNALAAQVREQLSGQVRQPSPSKGKVTTMVALKEITWEEASAPGFETSTRQAWRAAVAEIAVKAFR